MLLQPGRQIMLDGLFVASAYLHIGVARSLVHRMKYEGSRSAAAVLATAMTRLVPSGTTGLVPVPRARARVWRFGVDPAALLATLVSADTGIPVVRRLRSGLWWSSHSRGSLVAAGAVRMRAAADHLDPGWVLVDDVATSGATLRAAADALGGAVTRALVATVPPQMRSRLGANARSAL